jgi:hypothetical protein
MLQRVSETTTTRSSLPAGSFKQSIQECVGSVAIATKMQLPVPIEFFL